MTPSPFKVTAKRRRLIQSFSEKRFVSTTLAPIGGDGAVVTVTSHQICTHTHTQRLCLILAIWRLYIHKIFNPTHFPLCADSHTPSLFSLRFSHGHNEVVAPESSSEHRVHGFIRSLTCLLSLRREQRWYIFPGRLCPGCYLSGTGGKGRFYS